MKTATTTVFTATMILTALLLAGYGADILSADMLPSTTTKTCSGREVSGESAFYFGFKREWDGLCMTRKFIANDVTEAWKCARDSCQACQNVEDLTDLMSEYKNKPSAFDGHVMMKYCPRE